MLLYRSLVSEVMFFVVVAVVAYGGIGILEYGLVAYVLWQKEDRNLLVSYVYWLFGVVGKGGYAWTQTQAILRYTFPFI